MRKIKGDITKRHHLVFVEGGIEEHEFIFEKICPKMKFFGRCLLKYPSLVGKSELWIKQLSLTNVII